VALDRECAAAVGAGENRYFSLYRRGHGQPTQWPLVQLRRRRTPGSELVVASPRPVGAAAEEAAANAFREAAPGRPWGTERRPGRPHARLGRRLDLRHRAGDI